MRTAHRITTAFVLTLTIAGAAQAATVYNSGFTNTADLINILDPTVSSPAYSAITSTGALAVTAENCELQLLNGATATYDSTGLYWLGGTGCAIVVDGAGSSLSTAGQWRMADETANNSLTVSNGGSVYVAATFSLGYKGGDGDNNAITVDGGTFTMDGGRLNFGYNTGSSANTFTIINGGKASGMSRFSFRGADHSKLLISGTGSEMVVTGDLKLGEISSATNNVVELVNGGLMAASGSNLGLGGGNNKIRLAAGYMLVGGNQSSSSTWDDDVFEVYDGTSYVAGVRGSTYTATYFSDEAEATAAGFAGYGGYTVFTGGAAIPEPTTMALLGLGGLFAVRRRRS